MTTCALPPIPLPIRGTPYLFLLINNFNGIPVIKEDWGGKKNMEEKHVGNVDVV
ncbi:MAG: hypothetical protein MAG551_01575 [Candidatus Scalindua arabica]|uniref:Uncharacterized protein n=1 Tax=Candidatus Scalindua arabica TaxID=1127984 RepID=A0A941W420_9BACT|nr:hypothetical protein [Candidatus Scalindua arabica]